MQKNFLITDAAQGKPVKRTPVWLMRQAGRYQSEFREIRKKVDFLTLCDTPELVVEVSLLPIQQSGMDGAIIFSDLLVPSRDMGSDLEYIKGRGPVIHNPIRSFDDLKQLKRPDPSEASPSLGQAIRMLRKEVEPDIPVLGFTGAPWTTAAYMIEGGSSSQYMNIKKMMYANPELFHAIMEHITPVLADYLAYQAEAGVALVQLFDSWAGALSEADYRHYALPYTQKVISLFKERYPDVSVVLYVNNSHHFLEASAESGADVLSIDWRIPIDEAYRRVGDKVAFQGNFEPLKLFAPQEEIEKEIKAILNAFPAESGHIFNLGHGILPGTPVENVQFFVECVKKHSAR